MKLDRIVVAIDFSERSIAAAQWVAQFFAPTSELVLVHVLPVPRAPRFLRGSYPLSDEALDTWRAGAKLRLRQLGQQIGRGLIREEVRMGQPDEQVVAVTHAYEADLIVLGSHRDRVGLWNRLGSTAERILGTSSVPVLVVHGAPQEAPRRLLAAVDDSVAGAAVIEHMRALTTRFAARGKLAHVLPEQMIQRLLATGEVIAHEVRLIQAEQNLVAETHDWLARQAEKSGDALEPAVMLGDPAEAILREASHAGTDLLILGRERKSKARRRLLGSVSSAVLRGAKCPVLVIPQEQAMDAVTEWPRAEQSQRAARSMPDRGLHSKIEIDQRAHSEIGN